jgi:hypothetical protein
MHAELQALNVLAFASTKVQILTQEEEGRVQHITCFTSTKVQILTQPEGSSVQQIYEGRVQHITCFTSTKVQILMQPEGSSVQQIFIEFLREHAADIAELQSRVQALTKTFSMAVTKPH